MDNYIPVMQHAQISYTYYDFENAFLISQKIAVLKQMLDSYSLLFMKKK